MRKRFSDDLAIDLGTDTTRIHSLRRGPVLTEPTVLARDRQTLRIVAAGGRALEMLGRTPQGIEAVRPAGRPQLRQIGDRLDPQGPAELVQADGGCHPNPGGVGRWAWMIVREGLGIDRDVSFGSRGGRGWSAVR